MFFFQRERDLASILESERSAEKGGERRREAGEMMRKRRRRRRLHQLKDRASRDCLGRGQCQTDSIRQRAMSLRLIGEIKDEQKGGRSLPLREQKMKQANSLKKWARPLNAKLTEISTFKGSIQVPYTSRSEILIGFLKYFFL